MSKKHFNNNSSDKEDGWGLINKKQPVKQTRQKSQGRHFYLKDLDEQDLVDDKTSDIPDPEDNTSYRNKMQ
jgi:hypothetical protein